MLLLARLEKEGVNQQTEKALQELESERPKPPKLNLLRKQAVSWLMAWGDLQLEGRNYDAALANYEKAGSYGADPEVLQQRRANVKEARIRYLIEDKRFQEAEEALLKWEVTGSAPQETLSALYILQRDRLKKWKKKLNIT